MKLVLSAFALATIATPAFATSIRLSEVCGTVRQERVFCIVAPCPQPLVLELGKGKTLNLATGNDTRLREEVRALRDRKACLRGYKDVRNGVFEVVEIK